MRYKILLFDLDDTLLDFKANESESLKQLFINYGYELTDEYLTSYKQVNQSLWDAYGNGEITLSEVLNTRFSKTLALYDHQIDGEAWEKQYRHYLGNGAQLMDGAVTICETLSKTHRLFIATNGVRETQEKRLKKAGIRHYFEAVFDSQSIGHQKPTAAFFDYVKEHIKDFDRTQALMIGDSLKADIVGGKEAGIDTCWLTDDKDFTEQICTYKISKLEELLTIV